MVLHLLLKYALKLFKSQQVMQRVTKDSHILPVLLQCRGIVPYLYLSIRHLEQKQ
jgi:hypothetical protein